MEDPRQPAHPILACAEVIEGALKDAAGVDPAFMRPGEKADALRRLDRLESRLAALRMRVMANAEEVADETADHSAATWLACETHTDPQARYAELGLARSLDRRWTRLAAAVAEGSVNLAQARVIAHALEDLPVAEVGVDAVARAEEALIGYAGQHGPRQLRRLARRILEVAAPDTCEEAEGRALEREERRAAAVTSLSLHRLGDGTTRISGRVADAVADRLRTYLDAYTSPRHRGLGEGDRVPPRRRLGEAFGAFLEAADPARMPLHGGDATTVLVTIDHETLASQLAGIGLVGEDPISAAQARRLACTAEIIPVVLGGDSEVLDLGRSRRLYSRRSARRWRCATDAAAPRAAPSRPRGARLITDIPGRWVDAPTSRTECSSAAGTTTAPTTTVTTSVDYPTATTASTGAAELARPRGPLEQNPRISPRSGRLRRTSWRRLRSCPPPG